MDDDKNLAEEIAALRKELEHVFPEHERQYRQLTHRLQEKEAEYRKRHPVQITGEKSLWKRLFGG